MLRFSRYTLSHFGFFFVFYFEFEISLNRPLIEPNVPRFNFNEFFKLNHCVLSYSFNSFYSSKQNSFVESTSESMCAAMSNSVPQLIQQVISTQHLRTYFADFWSLRRDFAR